MEISNYAEVQSFLATGSLLAWKKSTKVYAHLLLVLQYLFYGSSVTEHLPEALLLMLLVALWPVRANHDPQAPNNGAPILILLAVDS